MNVRLSSLCAAALLCACNPYDKFSDAAIAAAPVGERLPASFLLGTATSAWQTEGGLVNDWSVWSETSFPDGTPHTRHGDVLGQAVDSWNRFNTDVTLLQRLGVNAYRFGV